MGFGEWNECSFSHRPGKLYWVYSGAHSLSLSHSAESFVCWLCLGFAPSIDIVVVVNFDFDSGGECDILILHATEDDFSHTWTHEHDYPTVDFSSSHTRSMANMQICAELSETNIDTFEWKQIDSMAASGWLGPFWLLFVPIKHTIIMRQCSSPRRVVHLIEPDGT